MCFSAEASFTAAAVLVPAGAVTIYRAYRTNRQYLPIAALPLLFGLQQLFEGLVWTGNALSSDSMVERYSMAYMFFSWLAWPVWVPFSTYFLEPCRRRYIYMIFAILGGMLGAMQYLPYFAHEGWLVTKFLPYAISYQGTVLFDFIMQRDLTYAIYLFVVIAPLLTSSNRRAQMFGVLISMVATTTYLFFQFAYISVFCFGGALMSLYIVYMVFAEAEPTRSAEAGV
ncbi:MAG: hypothetical protein K8F92_08650 [Hyphomicrobium sp.]|uniref:DUF6629 family protein n=1 Tax=Hyphomicrobium sp. TaxID=82 RepID=UPI0013262E8B|nr:DUF6629 family protein [Hyphomicrobium sp.]KAB2943564.1 MAG: hypothetical protein F9K20_02525 [Hyphomicrobium sp.]MBZ0209711.1 hypothetical protein [Hyphomicrobium sp.]